MDEVGKALGGIATGLLIWAAVETNIALLWIIFPMQFIAILMIWFGGAE